MAKQRRFELKDGKSAKFWAIELSGSSHTTTYGRIGTDGQSTTKDFADNPTAKASYEKLIEQKTDKGYVEIGAGGKPKATKKSAKKKAAKKAPAKKKPVTKKTAKTSVAKKKPTKKKAAKKKAATKTVARKSTKATKTKKAATARASAAKGQYLIEVKAELPMLNHSDKRTKKPEELKLLDGFIEKDSVCNYIYNEDLENLGLTGGFVRVEFDPKAKKLFMITDYNSVTELSKQQLKLLEKETRGQWSDGIGEGCFDRFMDQSGYGVETSGLKIKTTQTKGQATTPKTHRVDQKQLAKAWKQAMKKNQPTGSKKEFQQLMLGIYKGNLKQFESQLGKVSLDKWHKFSGNKDYWFDGETPLTYACEKKRPNFVQLLLDNGADPRFVRENGDGPIHCCNEEKCLQLLLDAGVSPKEKTKNHGKHQPLHKGNILQSTKAVKLLLSRGADPNASSKDVLRRTPLEVAAKIHHTETVKLLLAAGAEPTEHALDKAASCLPDWDENKETSEKQIRNTMKLLMDAGVEVTTEVVFHSIQFARAARLKLLFSTGFDVNHPPYGRYVNSEKKMLLQIVAENPFREEGIVDVLLKFGADPNKCPQALDAAIKNEDDKCIRKLLKAGAKPTEKQLAAAQDLDTKIIKAMEKAAK